MKRDWNKLKKVGRPKAIPTPERLWELACDYFEDVDNNPITKEELIKGGMFAGDKGTVNLQRPYTFEGLEVYLYLNGIISKLDDYRANTYGNYSEFQDVVRVIEKTIRTQKFEGASAGIFNASIISAELGIAKKIEQTVTVEQPLFPEDSTGRVVTQAEDESLLD